MSAAAAGASALGLMPPEYQRVLERVKAEQTGLTKLIGMQQQFETQLNENAMVKEELANDPSTVYKLFGRVLVKQDVAEAKATVDSRIAFIQTEMAKIEKNIKEGQAKVLAARKELMEVQKQFGSSTA